MAEKKQYYLKLSKKENWLTKYGRESKGLCINNKFREEVFYSLIKSALSKLRFIDSIIEHVKKIFVEAGIEAQVEMEKELEKLGLDKKLAGDGGIALREIPQFPADKTQLALVVVQQFVSHQSVISISMAPLSIAMLVSKETGSRTGST